MSDIAMSNETDLDWLALNVHVWNESAYAAMCGGVERVLWISGAAYGQMPEFKSAVTRDQWLARRAELQNKPSWDHAPEWAVYMAQSPNGHWEFFAVKPRDEGWWRHPIGERSSANNASIRGAILGDWSDTLEKRPEEFKQFTSIEDNQDQKMKQDNGWFERGELPPVGTVCEYTLGANAPWYKCEIKYVIRGNGVVMKRIPCGGEQYCELLHRNPVSFHPIRTEREVLIEIIKKTDDTDDKIAEAILAAGFKRGEA